MVRKLDPYLGGRGFEPQSNPLYVKILFGDRPPKEALKYTDYMPFYGWLYHGVMLLLFYFS